MHDFYFDNICILHVMLLDAGSITGAEKVWKKSTSFIPSLFSTICFCCFLHICTDVSLQVTKHLDSKKRHFIVMLKLIHPTDHTVMKEPACFIGYAIWISIGCHASYPIQWWQAAFPMYMQSVICHLRGLMKRIKREEFYIQTDGKCNFHTRQPYVQRFAYWFLIKDLTGILWVRDHLMKLFAPPDHFENSQNNSG